MSPGLGLSGKMISRRVKRWFDQRGEGRKSVVGIRAQLDWRGRSLDVGLARREAMDVWSRDVGEMASIRAQDRMYDRLGDLRESVPSDSDLSSVERFVAPLTLLTAFDLGQGRLTTFSAYRFLYERLLGARSRPWLPSAFCAASALPSIQPDMRRTLLHSISEAAATAAGWSTREPVFFPFWVEKVEEIPRAA